MTSETLAAGILAAADAKIHDAVTGAEYAGVRWTRNSGTGITMHRLDGENIVQSWHAFRTPEMGPWRDDAETAEPSELVAAHTKHDSAPARATIERYLEVRSDQSRAEELRGMFAEPAISTSRGPTRVEDIGEMIERVRREPIETPNLLFVPQDLLCVGDRALLRWTYLDGDSVEMAGLALYAFEGPLISERWQATLPEGVGWH